MGHAVSYISGIFSSSLFSMPIFDDPGSVFMTLILLSFFIFIEWIGREEQFAIANIGRSWNRVLRWLFYSLIISLIGIFMQTTESPFIYFQF